MPSLPVEIVAYDPHWPETFEREKARVWEALAPYVLAIEHIGSTSVPGLASKPIVDLLAGVYRFDDFPRCIPRAEALGYSYYPEFEEVLPEGRLFVHRRADAPRGSEPSHLLVAEVGTPFWERHLLFRDWLRLHPEDRERYASLKRELARKHGTDREAYTEAKTEFIRSIEEK